MSITTIDGLPSILENVWLTLRVSGQSAYIRSDKFIARFDLHSGNVDWLVERPPMRIIESTESLPRIIDVFSSDLWVSAHDQVVAEIISTECGGLNVAARDSRTGKQLWEQFVAIPPAADWAESLPAWPEAQTEEIDAFIAEDPHRLIVGLARQTRRSGLSDPSRGIHCFSLPPYACQTDAIRFHVLTGKPIWQAEFRDVPVRIIERRAFTGIWSNSPKLGMIDFETGTNTVLHEFPHSLGWPVHDGFDVAVPWYSKSEVGVEWVDKRGSRVRSGAWRLPRVDRTYLHPTAAGLAMQTNDQMLWWLGEDNKPAWNTRAKPYIYRVHRSPKSDVFIGTDGNGGRLLGHDAHSGRETLNLKPASAGVGHLTKVPGHDVLVSTFGISRSNSLRSKLLVLSMENRQHRLAEECFLLLGTWEHGAICRVGRLGERLAVIDIRNPAETSD